MNEEARDLEALNWSHTAEDREAYKNMVGASGMGGFSESPDRKKRADYFTIVALADDMSMSTMANDTLDGTMLHSNVVGVPPSVVTANTNKNANTTPPKMTKQKYLANLPKKQISSLDPDEVTQPETPHSEHGQKQFNTEGVSKMRQLPSNDTRCSLPMKRGMCIASILGCIILGAIGVLSYTFYQMRSEPESHANENDLDTNAPDFDFRPIFNSTSNVDEPDEEEEQAPAGTTNLRTANPTQSPTTDSTAGPTTSNFDILLEALSLTSPNSTEALNNAFSAQRAALQWLSIDPNLSEYSMERIVQRWAMATFFLSVSGEYASNGRVLQMDDQENTTSGWMTYTDECTWNSKQGKSSCSDDGKVLNIHLEDIGLAGVLPPEISLLSDSLEQIYLSSNEIRGTIPTELGLLTNLLRLQLTVNSLEGTIPAQLGLLEKLRVLGLGRNEIGGTLPPELGLLSNLEILGLEANRLNGTIPAEYAGMTSLTAMSLKNNELSGTVPSELGRLSLLSTLTLHYNNLRGQVPLEVCNIAIFDVLKADCDEITCPCCTDCCIGCAPPTPPPTPDLTSPPTSPLTLSPSSAPSASLKTSNVPTSVPPTPPPTPDFSAVSTVPPTLSPSSAPSDSVESSSRPTECSNTVMSEKSCYLVDEPIVFEFHICDGVDTDLISLYEDDATFKFSKATFWTRTCGLPNCRATLGDNILSYDNKQPYRISFSTWPAKSGSYKLRLLRVTSTQAIAQIAESAVIEISRQCN